MSGLTKKVTVEVTRLELEALARAIGAARAIPGNHRAGGLAEDVLERLWDNYHSDAPSPPDVLQALKDLKTSVAAALDRRDHA